MSKHYRILTIILLCSSFFTTIAIGQDCSIPFGISFSQRTTTSILAKWSDSNTNPLYWEIELVKKDSVRKFLPNVPNAPSKQASLTNLIANTTYEMYIRAVCSEENKSAWNGPIIFTTVLTNPTSCKSNLSIRDNGTEVFQISVNQSGIIGQSVFIQSIDLIVEHTWPADLKITLEAPNGDQVVLSQHNGTITDHFGDPFKTDCSSFTRFTQDACLSLDDEKPPYIGNFKPDGDLSTFAYNSNASGFWKLIFFDRALKDIGILKFFKINFSTQACRIPSDFVITDVGNTSISLDWGSFPSCETVVLTVTPLNGNANQVFIDCDEANQNLKKINDLLPNTDYSVTIGSLCGLAESPPSCPLFFTTTCNPRTVVENFDNQNICEPSCNAKCNLSSQFWQNDSDDNNQDWIVWQGETDTENTGPDSDISLQGKYIYLESSPNVCSNVGYAYLQSPCMQISTNELGCDMSLYYHMFGSDVDSFFVQISCDNGATWNTLFEAGGNKSKKWQKITLSLADYDEQHCVFRIGGRTSIGVFGDIAIDNIEFFGSTLLEEMTVYYVDTDNDGYGIDTSFITICSAVPPIGYSRFSGDCDDTNANIFPNAVEIQCNGIDENCNGLADDAPEFNPITIDSLITHESCRGSLDGSISLQVQGGTPPYSFLWSNGLTTQNIIGLSSGFYKVTISDLGGCIQVSPYYQVTATNNLQVIVSQIIKPTCLGINDGAITIAHNLTSEPYSYNWSNGATTQNVSNLMQDTYSVTVVDGQMCESIINNITIDPTPKITINSAQKTNVSCFGGQNGKIEIAAQNGSSPYSYSWNNGETTALITNLPKGIYQATITDSNGCQATFQTTILEPDQLISNISSIENVRCAGETNGIIKTNATGGTPPYTYLWNNFSLTDDLFNVSANEYTLIVSDSRGCKSPPLTAIVREPDAFITTIDSLSPALCINGMDGYVRLQSTGGTKPYYFVWSHTDSLTNSFNNLHTGFYSATAYDALGCKSSISSIFIPFENNILPISIRVIDSVQCFGQMNGSIESTVESNNPPFDYNWSSGIQYFNSKTNDTLNNIGAGSYTLTITDDNGCVGVSNTVSLKEPLPITYSISETIHNKCADDNKGKITLITNGGSKELQVFWDSFPHPNNTIDSLFNGVYGATIIDASQCATVIQPITITSISKIEVESTIIHDSNSDSSGMICIIPSGGISPYNFHWEDGTTTNCIDQLNKGEYTVEISDAIGCVLTRSYQIDNSSASVDQPKSEVILKPNPFTDHLYIQASDIIVNIEIINQSSKLLASMMSNHNAIEVNTDQWIPGMYIVKLRFINGYTTYHKVIKI